MAEIVTEKVSLDTLLDKISLDKSAWGYVAKNMLAEGSEEMASDLINWAGDVLVAKDKSQWKQAIQAYMAQGMGEKEAFQLALKDQAVSMGMSGLGGTLSGGLMSGGSVAVNGIMDSYLNRDSSTEQEAIWVEKTAPVEGAEYRATKPKNVEMPTVPLIDLSTSDIPGIKGVLPKTGEVLRKDAVLRARKRLGLDQGAAAYIPVSNVQRDGNEYILKITKASLNKMLNPAGKATLPIESIVVMDNLERITNNGVYFKSEGDRDARQQIPRWDHLMTTVYIDGVPYSVDMRVKLVEEKPGSELDNVLYYYSPEEIVKIEKVGPGAPAERRALSVKVESEPTSNPIIPTLEDGVNSEHVQGEVATEQTSLIGDQALNELMHDRDFVSYLERVGDLKLTKDMTQDQRRTAIREALLRAVQKKNVFKPGLEKPTGNDILEKIDSDALFRQIGGLTDGRGESPKGHKKDARSYAGTSAQDGDRSGVQETGGGVQEGRTKQTVSGNIFRGLTASFGQQPVKSWAKDTVITPPEGSIVQGEQQVVGEFYIPSYVIQDESGDQTPDAPFHQPMEKEEEWAETGPSESERKCRFISEFTGHVTTRGRLRISYQEIPVIRSALKSGLCKINADGSTGRVRTSAKEYQFDVIDGDVIIYDAVDNDELNIHDSKIGKGYEYGSDH